MNDIEIAKKILEEKDLRLVVVRDGKLIFKSNDRGIKPMYILATKMSENTKGASIADRVIGKGAAMLCRYIGVNEVYGQLMSNTAIKVLKESNITYTYNGVCPYIKNRDKTGMCPIEKISLEIEDMNLLLERIKEFLSNINKN
ncbi:DUF1893 domain-containing protein [Schnuerera sp. xch1]|uniref:DUF1893 domain-containing protein n=1 Tax=Schnuerera sp. xch1 TaxID=2874283 RepID=UPI001CC18589|nr:DUF1893 domain-containing protein [Schnuerera sp. xch1]MBZ2176017.1 DUF1893 domain-containing protein [Schnuerera sp. xch1]